METSHRYSAISQQLTMDVTFGKPELSGASALATPEHFKFTDANLAIGLELSNCTSFRY
jgi:hypothetical protein